jgi:glycosyltransferase involved in cell wall biosynthesis
LNGGRKKKGELALFRLAMKSVDGIIYHVKQQKLHYQKYFPDIVKKSRFVPFGPDLDLFSINKCEPNEDYLLSIGYAKRDWKTLISAYERLSSPKPGLRILGDSRPICGSLPKGVNATGKVSFIDMKGQIAGARFIVIPLPSPRYAVGQMTVLQSMAMGKAVIVSRVPSMIDYVTDYHDALFYTPADVNDLRDKMELLIRNPGMAKGIGYNARITIERKFNEPVMAKQIWEAISEMAVVPVPREK